MISVSSPMVGIIDYDGKRVKKTGGAEWLADLLAGKRVWLYGGQRACKRIEIAFIVSLPFGLFEVALLAREGRGVQLVLLPIFTMFILLGALYERGRVIHSSIQLSDRDLFIWDWRNQREQIEYKNIIAVECIKRFQHTKVSICLYQEQTKQMTWKVILTWFKGEPTARAVATEAARRAKLTKHSDRLWKTVYEEVLPPKLFWE